MPSFPRFASSSAGVACTMTSTTATAPGSSKEAKISKVRSYLAAMEHAGKCRRLHCKDQNGLCSEIRKGLIHISRCSFGGRFCAATACKNPAFTKTLINSRCCAKCSQIVCLLQLHSKQCANSVCFVCNASPQFIDRTGLCCPTSSADIKMMMMPPPQRRIVTPPPTITPTTKPYDTDFGKSTEELQNVVSPKARRLSLLKKSQKYSSEVPSAEMSRNP